jgi:translation initiation factor eIF-2B subunit beta
VNWLTLAGISKTGMGSAGDRNLMSRKLKHNVIEAITELLQEIDNCHSQVAEQALEHIHQNEVILTLGRSVTLREFLKEAKKKRSFQVVIAEGAPR